MKKLTLFIVIGIALNLFSVKAEASNYKDIYSSYFANTKNKEVLLYDMNYDGIPEMILTSFLTSSIYDIFTIKDNNVQKIHTLSYPENKDQTPLVFFITNNGNNLYYALEDKDAYNKITYYKLNYDGNKITSDIIANMDNNYFENELINLENDNFDFTSSYQTFYYDNKQVTESEFLESLNFKQIIPFLDTVDDNISSDPTDVSLHTRWKMYDDKAVSVYVKYKNGLFDIFPIGADINLLMINGNFIPKANIINDNNKVYLPLRTICNYIGEDIIYNAKNRSITLDNVSISLNENKVLSDNQPIDIKTLNGTTYISTEFFEKYLSFSLSTGQFKRNFDTSNNVVNIIALESNDPNKYVVSTEKAKDDIEKYVNNFVENKNTSAISYEIEEIAQDSYIGRYYIFNIEYYRIGEVHPTFKDKLLSSKILYDKYTGNVFIANGDSSYRMHNNKIQLY